MCIYNLTLAPPPLPLYLLISFSLQIRNSLASAAISAFFNNITAQQIRAFERRCHQLYPRRKRRMKDSQAAALRSVDSLSTKPNGMCYDMDSNNVAGDKNDVKRRLDR